MKKFEYKIIQADVGVLRFNFENIEKELNKLGADGWELIATALGQKFILKREIK